MDNFRDSYFPIEWDLSKKRIKAQVWGKQYDTGRGLSVTVISGGQVVTPTNEVLRLKWEKPDNTSGYVNSIIIGGKFIIENIDQMFTVAGSIRADLEMQVGGEFVASVTFYATVEKAVAVGAIESSSEFTALQEALAVVDDVQGQVDAVIANATVDSEVILARGAEPTLGDRLDGTDAQLAETGQRIDNIIATPIDLPEIYVDEIHDARQGKGSIGANITEVKTSLAHIAIDVTSFGALKNETNPTNTVQAIRNAIVSANVGDTVLIPSGKYAIDDTIVINKEINFICNGELIWYGTRDKAVIHFVRPRNVTIEFNGEVRDQQGNVWHGWSNNNYVGILIENAFRCKIRISVVRNFTTGVRLLASGGQSLGFFFNTFHIFQLIDNKTQLEIYKKDPNSWFNSNIFHDAFFSYTQSGTQFQTANVDRFCIKQTFENNVIPCDTNIFYNIRFDAMTNFGGTYTGISLERAWEWKFENYRCELVSGSNVKFAVLNCEFNQIRGMVFNPIFEAYTTYDNVMVNLLNVINPQRDYRRIFRKTGELSNVDFTPVYLDENWNKRYRTNRADYHIIDGVYRYASNGTTLTTTDETHEEFSGTERLIENGVIIGTSRLGALYLKGVQVGDTITVNLLTAVNAGTPAIHVKAWDNSDVLIDNNDVNVSGVNNKAIVATNTYWDTANKRLTQSVQRSTLTFSINRAEVKTVAVLFSGGLNGIQILSTRPQINVLRSIVDIRNNYPNHVVNAVPTKRVDGRFLPGERVFNLNNATGQPIGWELRNIDNTLQWVSLGNY